MADLDLGTLRYSVDADTGGIDAAGESLDRFKAQADTSSGSTKRYEKAVRDTDRQSKRLADTNRKVTRSFSLLRQVLPIASVAGLAMATRRMVSTFAEFEQSMARVRAVSRATDQQFAALSATARQLGATTEFSATQAASGLEFLSRAGWSANESISALPAVLNLATAASMDLGNAADVASNIMSGFGIAATEASSVADILAAASSRANTNVQQLGDAMSFVGPVASALKIPMGDTAAAIGALSDAGIQGSAAGTGLRRVLSSLANPTAAAAREMEAMGLTLDQVNPASNSLVEILDNLAGTGMSAAQALTIFGDRGGPAILALVENNAKVAELAGELRDVEGEASRMADTMRDTLTGDMKALSSAMQELTISAIGGLNGGLRSMVQGFTNAVRYINNNFLPIFTSGQFSAHVRAFAAQFDVMFRGIREFVTNAIDDFSKLTSHISRGFEMMWDIASSAFPGMAEEGASASDFIRDAFLNLPANLTSVIQLMAVEFASLVDYAKEAGKLIFEAFKLQFDVLVESTKLYGRAIGHYLNPFSSGDFSLGEEIAELSRSVRDQAAGMWEEAQARVRAISDARRESIMVIMEERDAAVSASADARAEAAELRAEYERGRDTIGETADAARGLAKALQEIDPDFKPDGLEDLADALDRIRREADPAFAAMQDFTQEMETLQSIFDAGLIDDDEFARLADHLNDVRDAAMGVRSTMENVGIAMAGISQGLGEIRNTMDSGSKEAEKLGIAMQALAVAQGIVAIVTQGTGDPYTAFGRMAAMAAAIAALGVNVGSMGGGGQSTAERRQQQQATGGVFGDAQAQSESILNATEITASAVSQLPALNRGMLSALQAIQIGIRGVTEGIVRGGGISGLTSDISTGRDAVIGSAARFGDPLAVMGQTLITPLGQGITAGLDELWNKLNKELLRTETRVIDSGVAFTAETLGAILESGVMDAVQFADIRERTRAFGLTVRESNNRVFQDLDDETSAALASVFIGMADAVTAGASALGIAEDEITQRINQFEIALGEISLHDLDPEEQQEQLNAVFSRIFDNLADSVVPFLNDFAQLGEGTAETLVRVATNIQVFEAAVDRLGFAAERVSAEQFAHMATDLIEMAGGMEQFITSMTGFFDKFASDSVKFDQAQRDLTAGLDQVGLQLPETSDGFFDLMQSLDASTQSGQEQIATLLRLQDAAAEYYSQVERLERQRQSLDIQLLELQGRSAEALAMQREIELAAMDESLHALQQRIWALQDEKDALRDLQSATDAAFDMLSRSVQTEISRLGESLAETIALVNEDFDGQVKARESWLDRQLKRYDQQISSISQSVSELSSLSSALGSAIGAQSVASAAASRIAAQTQLDAALGMARMGRFDFDRSFIQGLGRPTGEGFGAESEMQLDAARTAHRLIELQSLTDDQLSAEERTIAILQRRSEQAKGQSGRHIDAINAQREATIAELEQNHALEVSALQQMVIGAEEQINLLRGIEDGTLNVEEALRMFNESLRNEAESEANKDRKALVQEIKDMRKEQQQQAEMIARIGARSLETQQDLLISNNGIREDLANAS